MHLNAILLFLGDIGGGELMVILLAILVLFGADKIPGLARTFGSSIRQFKDATNGIRNELERSINEEPQRPKAIPPVQVPANPEPDPEIAIEQKEA